MMSLSSPNAPTLDLPARFMGMSMIALLIMAVTTPWTLPFVQGPFSDFDLLVFVHLNTLGVIGAMIIGASYQLVPVALQTPLASPRLGRLSFWFYLPGVAIFLLGLLETWLYVLVTGATLLVIAFALYIGVIVATWRRTPHRDIVAWHILLGLVGVTVGMSLGFVLAHNKTDGMLGSHVLNVLVAHIVLMLGDWVLVTFMGVAYRLIGMFTLSEQQFRPKLAWTELALTEGGVWLVALRFAFDLPSILGQIGAVLLVAGVVCFLAQLVHLYRRRMRRGFDIHIPFAATAALLALASAVFLAFGLLAHRSPLDPIWVAAVWLAILGAAETAIQGFFYKIATFLVWLKRYAPVAGRQPVPKLEQLYHKRLAVAGWACWTLAVLGGAAIILGQWDALRWVVPLVLAGTGCFLINVTAIARHWLQPGAPAESTTLAPRRSVP